MTACNTCSVSYYNWDGRNGHVRGAALMLLSNRSPWTRSIQKQEASAPLFSATCSVIFETVSNHKTQVAYDAHHASLRKVQISKLWDTFCSDDPRWMESAVGLQPPNSTPRQSVAEVGTTLLVRTTAGVFRRSSAQYQLPWNRLKWPNHIPITMHDFGIRAWEHGKVVV